MGCGRASIPPCGAHRISGLGSADLIAPRRAGRGMQAPLGLGIFLQLLSLPRRFVWLYQPPPTARLNDARVLVDRRSPARAAGGTCARRRGRVPLNLGARAGAASDIFVSPVLYLANPGVCGGRPFDRQRRRRGLHAYIWSPTDPHYMGVLERRLD
jgi:hypothetical protein